MGENGAHGITRLSAALWGRTRLNTSRNRPPRTDRNAGPGRVRIVGGRWRGTRLDVPDVPGLRPTSDRVRETLFNWLQPALPGARVLDLFAGTGALGLEAVSRGAAHALLVERDAGLAAALTATVSRLSAGDAVQVRRGEAVATASALPAGSVDIAFVDPPFALALWTPALAALFDGYRVFYGQPSDPVRAGAFLRERLERGDSHLLMATDARGGALGFVQLYPSFTSVGTAPIEILNDLFVDQAARGVGVARALLRRAADDARSRATSSTVRPPS